MRGTASAAERIWTWHDRRIREWEFAPPSLRGAEAYAAADLRVREAIDNINRAAARESVE